MNENSESFGEVCRTLREKLRAAVRQKSFDGTFLSGGLDTSVINYVANKEKSDFESISVGFKESSAVDLKYSEIMVDELNINNHVVVFNFSEAKEAAEEVVRIMESFDPIEIRNDISLYVGLQKAKELGLTTILTGDGGDELLAGYSFLYELPLKKMKEELEKMWKIMSFSSQRIGKRLGIRVEIPFLDENFKKFAMNLEPNLKVGEKEGKKLGKWILRKAYENKLPKEIIWRKKAPIETGTGTAVLPEKFKSSIGEKKFKSKRRKIKEEDEVLIRSEEQLFYYNIYSSCFDPPKEKYSGGKQCPYCKSEVPENATFCRTCGSGVENKE